MSSFLTRDGTRLAYREVGAGEPLVCLPGGPMQASTYLGNLGGLSDRRRLILLDHRGTGESAIPRDPLTYRCDHLVDDVEALREHLGLDRLDLLAHSAGTNVALLYAARYPDRIAKLLLVTPSTYAVGITATAEMRRAVVRLREHEEWFGPAFAAFEAIQTPAATAADWAGIAPLTYGRWDEVARAHAAAGEAQRNSAAAAVFGADGAFDPPATRTALAAFPAPVMLLAGELDVAAPPSVVADLAALFPDATVVIQSGAGHFPWLDDAARFSSTVTAFFR